MIRKNHMWKIAGIYLIVFNLILLVVFSGFVMDDKIGDNRVDYINLNNDYSNLTGIETVIGNENATITLILYTDYESPFCRKFDDKVLDKIKEEYVNTGKVKIIVKDSPVPEIHKHSLIASQAVKCANENGKGLEMQKLILDEKHLSEDKIKSFGFRVGLDNDSFCECIDSEKYLDDVLMNMEKAKENEIRVVPTLIIGENKIEGLKPYFVIKKAIDKELGVEN